MKNKNTKKYQLIYDGKCNLCINSMRRLKKMDLFGCISFIDLHTVDNFLKLHPQLNKRLVSSQLYLIDFDGNLYGGFYAFRKMSLIIPMMMPLVIILYFPGMGILGPKIYRFIAKNRFLFRFNHSCQNNSCFR